MATLGWIGTGEIGAPMLGQLLKAGHRVMLWGRHRSNLQASLSAGAQLADSPAALASACDAVFLCITDADAVESVVFSDHGIASGQVRGKLLIDHSSIHPQRSRQLAARLLQQAGMDWLDAPVSGGRVGAENASLAVFVGGNAAHLERARGWMSAYAARVTHVGASGAGQIAKSCNQAVVCATLAAWAEVINYADNCEVDVPAMVNALEGSWSDSPIRKLHVPYMVSGQYPPGHASLMLKDLDIVGDMARVTRSPMPVVASVTALFRQLLARFADKFGPSSIMRVYRNDTGAP